MNIRAEELLKREEQVKEKARQLERNLSMLREEKLSEFKRDLK